MSMSSRLTDAFTRIGQEFKAVRSSIAQKYTKPVGGIPLEDLSNGVTERFTPTWSNLQDKPATFSPATHDHPMTQVTGLVNALAEKVTVTSGSQVFLWVGPVANLPTTKNPKTVYLAW